MSGIGPGEGEERTADAPRAAASDNAPARAPTAAAVHSQPLSRTARFAWGMVIAILIGVVALVVYVVTVPPATPSADTPVPTPPSVVAALSHIPASAFDAVGADVTVQPTPLTAPRVVVGQPPLLIGGKPEVLFVGAEYCPFCAAERWPLVVALSRFGRFTGLHDAQSGGSSVFAGIQTFSFTGVHFESRHLSLVGVELYSDQLEPDGSYTRVASLTPSQAALVQRFGSRSNGSAVPIPFLDIGNRMVATTSAFSPALLTRQSQSDLVAALDSPDRRTAQAVLAAANQLTAGICLATGQQPAVVCTSKGVRAADSSLGIT